MTATDPVDTWEHLVRFHRAATKAMDQNLRTSFGQTLDDYDILHQINVHNGPIRMGDLADRLLFANSSCHRLVTKLVDADLVQRHHDESDRRVILVQLTPTGKRLRRRMAAAHTRDIRQLLGATLDPHDGATLNQTLHQLTDFIDGEPPRTTGA